MGLLIAAYYHKLYYRSMVKQISVGSELEKSRKNRYAFLKEIVPFAILCPKTC